jgi:iron(III) transport system permease protein
LSVTTNQFIGYLNPGRRFTSLGGLATLVVTLAIIPLLFVIYNSLQLSTTQWLGLWSSRLPELLKNTLSLAVLVSIGSVTLGVSSAWWISRREFPGRKLAVWLMVLPLTIPTYVFAHIYTSLLEEDGWLGQLWILLTGNPNSIPDLYNIWGVTLVIEVFWRVNLPLLRPAIAAGLAVVVLHVLSDFGAVSMLRFQTFTLSIYLQMSGRFDYQAAAGLSMILVLLSLTFLVLERFFRQRQQYYSAHNTQQQPRHQATNFETAMIWIWLGLITLLAFGLPIAWMLSWSWEAWTQNLINSDFWRYTSNSLLIAVIAASLAVCAALLQCPPPLPW